MGVIETGIVFKSRINTDAASTLFPTVCVLDSGRWVVIMRLAPAKNCRTSRTAITTSDDEGKTWSDPRLVAEPISINNKPGCWRSGAPTALGGERFVVTLCWEETAAPWLPMFNEQTEGLVHMKLYLTFSDDGGKTFSKPIPVDCGKYRDVPTPITGAALALPDDKLAVQFEVNKHYNDTTPWRHASCIVITPDNGKTWGEAIDIHSDPELRVFCWDQRPGVLQGGELLDMFWTFDRKTAQYRNIHAAASKDSGLTWTDVWDTGVPGQPATPVRLPDGRVVMVYVDREGEPTIKARVSSDGGKTWPASTEVVVHKRELKTQTRGDKTEMKDAWAEMSKFSLGLPNATLLPNGDVLSVYYTGDSTDYTSCGFTRLRF